MKEKVTTISELKSLLTNHFRQKLEGVNRSRRSGDSEDDYHDEDEGEDVSYDESVDRARRGDGQEYSGEYQDEYEGAGVTYESNLYTDKDVDKVGGKEEVQHGEELSQDTHQEEDEASEEVR